MTLTVGVLVAILVGTVGRGTDARDILPSLAWLSALIIFVIMYVLLVGRMGNRFRELATRAPRLREQLVEKQAAADALQSV